MQYPFQGTAVLPFQTKTIEKYEKYFIFLFPNVSRTIKKTAANHETNLCIPAGYPSERIGIRFFTGYQFNA